MGKAYRQIFLAFVLLAAEGEIDSGRVFEVILTSGIACPVDSKTSQQVVDFNWTGLDVPSDRISRPPRANNARCLSQSQRRSPVAKAAQTLRWTDISLHLLVSANGTV